MNSRHRPPLDAEAPTLILKLHLLHHGGLGIVRSLGRAGVPVYAVRDRPFTPATTSRYITRTFRTQGPAPSDLVAQLLAIGREVGGRCVLVPTDDASAVVVAEHAALLREVFLLPGQSPSLPRFVSDKAALHGWCEEQDIPCPRTATPRSEREVREFLAGATFPLVAKVAESWTLSPRSKVKSTSIVRSPEEALALHSALPEGSHLLFQEHIPAHCGEDWFFHGYCNERSECLVSFTGTKLRSYPAYTGMTTLGTAVDNEALRATAEHLLRTLGYRGVMDLCYRFDRRDGQYKLLDFNPRVGAQFRLFENGAGVDVVTALHLDMTGRPVPQAPQVSGRVLLVENYDLLASWRYIRDGNLRVRDWMSSQWHATERGWLAADDPVPFAAMCLRQSWKGVERISAGRVRRRDARALASSSRQAHAKSPSGAGR